MQPQKSIVINNVVYNGTSTRSYTATSSGSCGGGGGYGQNIHCDPGTLSFTNTEDIWTKNVDVTGVKGTLSLVSISPAGTGCSVYVYGNNGFSVSIDSGLTSSASWTVNLVASGDGAGIQSVNKAYSVSYTYSSTPPTPTITYVEIPTLEQNSFQWNYGNSWTVSLNYSSGGDYWWKTSDSVSTASDVGNYSVKLALYNTTNYRWEDGTTGTKILSWSITKRVWTRPVQSGSLTYNGSTQTPTWEGGPDGSTTYYTTNGTSSAVSAGNYYLRFTIQSSYQSKIEWQGAGGTATVQGEWTIGKASWGLQDSNILEGYTTGSASFSTIGYINSFQPAINSIYYISGSDYLSIDIDEERISRNTLSWTGNTQTTLFSLKQVSNNNYNEWSRVTTLTSAIWKTITPNWNIPSSVTLSKNSSTTVEIENYDSSLTYVETQPSSICGYSRSGSTITLTSGSTIGTTSFEIYTSESNNNYVHCSRYPQSGSKVCNITVVNNTPGWSLSSDTITLIYNNTSGSITVNNMISGLTYEFDDSRLETGTISLSGNTITFEASSNFSYADSSVQIYFYSNAGQGYDQKTVTITIEGRRATPTWPSVCPSPVRVNCLETRTLAQLPQGFDYSITNNQTSYFEASINNYDLIVEGIKGIEQGVFTISSARNNNYEAATKIIYISIDKLQQTWTLGSVTVPLNNTKELALNAYGTLTVTIADDTIASATTEGSTITFTGLSLGQTTYSVYASGNDIYEPKTQNNAQLIIGGDKCVRIYYNGAWHKAIPYIYGTFNGETKWHKAEAWVYPNNDWKPTAT